jgi:hypothetical protein
MPDVIALVVRELNAVASAGQARAAIVSAETHLDYGASLTGSLSMWSSPTTDEANETLSMLRGALDAELRTIGSQADDSEVDPQSWARARRQVERAYVEVSGIEGAAGASLDVQIQAPSILADAIADAPRVFGHAAGEVLGAAGAAAGQIGGGFLSGLGVVGVIVLVVIVVLVVRGAV